MSQPQGVTVNDPAVLDSLTDHQLDLYGKIEGGNFIIEVPFSDASCSVCLTTARGNFMALSINDAIKHVKDTHDPHTPKFVCKACHKEYVSKHAALCHVPKCTGPEVPPPNAVRCNHCNRYFRTQMGVSQHEIKAHPQVRNEARAGTSGAERQRAPREGGFTVEEVDLMLDLERRFYGDSRIAKRMEGFLNRTAKQLRDKRALSSYRTLRDQYLRDHPPQDTPSSHLDSDSAGYASSQEGIEERSEPDTLQVQVPVIQVTPAPDDLSSPELAEWRSGILEHALAHQLPQGVTPDKSAEAIHLLQGALRLASEPDFEFSQAQIDFLYQEATSHFRPSGCEAGGNKSPRVRGKGRSKRRFLYARTQELYKKNPGQVAKHVRQGVDWIGGYQQPPMSEVKELYTKLWGVAPLAQMPEGINEDPIAPSEALPPFTVDEIRKRISATKQSTAPGPDGIRRADVMQRGKVEVLHLLFNLLLLSGKLPTDWSMNRTTLIPKEGKDVTKTENFRPVTITSLVSRIFWGCIDQKIRSVVGFTPRQKGFISSEAGCFNNVHILVELLRHSKATGKNLVVTILDISKAFDTVPHSILGPSLRRKGLPPVVAQLVEESYKNVCTKISTAGGSVEINLQRGVRQGDPLSPFAFNAVLEPLLLELERQSGYRISNNTHIASLAFADDLVLVSEDVQQATHQLHTVEAYLERLSMRLSPKKCVTFHIKPLHKTWSVVDPGLTLMCGERIPHCGAGGRVAYLGVEISPWAGISIESIESDLASALSRVKRLALKPHQKVELISTYLVPHYLYQLGMAAPAISEIRKLDQAVRVVIKDILHLPQSTTDCLIYCGKRDGGLGFPRLETQVVGATLRAGSKFLGNSADPVMQALATGAGLVQRLAKLAQGARLRWPVTQEDLKAYKLRAKKAELARWASLGSQGKSVASLTDDTIGNSWLFSPSLLKPCRYITALQMRTNTCPNRVALNRAVPQPDLFCRQCRTKLETLGHILGDCTATKRRRIRRHDEISDLIVDRLRKQGNQVAIINEPRLQHPLAGNLKPDLVVKYQERVVVVDVTVRHEDGDSLARGRTDKVQKYSSLLPGLQQRLKVTAGEVLPVVVGTRGAMPKETISSLARIGIKDKSTLKTISMIALRCSIEIFHEFMDYDAPLRRHRHRRRGQEDPRNLPGP